MQIDNLQQAAILPLSMIRAEIGLYYVPRETAGGYTILYSSENHPTEVGFAYKNWFSPCIFQ